MLGCLSENGQKIEVIAAKALKGNSRSFALSSLLSKIPASLCITIS